LISASGYQAHTTSPSAFAPFVNAPPKRPSHPAPNVRDDRDTPLFSGAGWRGLLKVICPTTQAKYFRLHDWTVDSALIGFGKSGFWRNAIPVIARSESDEAIQSLRRPDWIASLSLAMTWMWPGFSRSAKAVAGLDTGLTLSRTTQNRQAAAHRLGRNVCQPYRVLADQFAGHKAERWAKALR
jgi:hypothetical protein